MNRYIGVDSYRKEEKSYSLQLKGLYYNDIRRFSVVDSSEMASKT